MDSSLRLPKACYAFYYAAAACFMPFLPLFYGQIGLSGDQIGLLVAIPTALVLVGGPLWGRIADASGRHRLVLAAAIGGSIALSQSLLFTDSFWWLVPLVLGLAFFMSPIVPLVDHAVMELLGPRPQRYGKVRLWGGVGWGLAGPLIGWIVDRFGLDWSFHSYALLMAGFLLVVLRLPVGGATVAPSSSTSLKALLAERRWQLFLLLAFVGGLGSGFAFHYFFLYMEALGASRALMGWSLTVATVSELVAFALGDRLVRRWGAQRLLLIGALAALLRLAAYAVATTPMQGLAVQLLHGPSFALMWIAGVSQAKKLAPVGSGATAQALFSGVNFGLGGTTAALIGGALYQRLGAQALYSWAALGTLAGLALYLVAQRLYGGEPAARG
ncbi:MAG: MFS transporter [Candidatus Latescibacteria bacterium]|nr:MFS transporter [Candidatus Latescibacterota bacterium]